MHYWFWLALQSQYFINGICARVAIVFHLLSSDSEKELEPRAENLLVHFSVCEDQRKVGPKRKERGDAGGTPAWEKLYWAPEEALGIGEHPTRPWGKVESEKNRFQGQHVANKHNLKNVQPLYNLGSVVNTIS